MPSLDRRVLQVQATLRALLLLLLLLAGGGAVGVGCGSRRQGGACTRGRRDLIMTRAWVSPWALRARGKGVAGTVQGVVTSPRLTERPAVACMVLCLQARHLEQAQPCQQQQGLQPVYSCHCCRLSLAPLSALHSGHAWRV